MPIFKIKETERVMTAYIYEVEANTKEEAVKLYTERLAGSLPLLNSFIVPDLTESVVAYE